MGRRAVWRDYVDIFYLLHEKILTFDEIVKLGKKQFCGEFNEILFAQQLCYFKDLDTGTPIVFIKKSFTEEAIRTFLEKQVEEYVEERLKES